MAGWFPVDERTADCLEDVDFLPHGESLSRVLRPSKKA